MNLHYPQGDSNEPQKLRENKGVPDPRGTDSGTPADVGTADALAAALLALPPAERQRLAALLQQTGQEQGE